MVWKRRIAYINLTTGKIISKPIPKQLRQLYLGGRGINMYLLYNHLTPEVDPLSSENILLVGTGLLCGIPALGSGRCDIAAKSPVTGAIGDSNIGGFFAPELRLAGFDHLMISGKAEKPVYLLANDGNIEIHDANHLWGKDTFETQDMIRDDVKDEEVKSLVIGVAGENMVRFANVRTGMKNSAGRTGMGCVMGSKNLKAIAARGTMDIEFSHPDELLDYCKQMNDMITETRWARAQSKWGTLIIYSNTNTTGLIRTRNFQLNRLEKGEDLEPENMDRYTIGMSGCYGCSVHCRHRYVLKEGSYAPIFAEGPEYTSLGAFGTMVDCNKMETVLVANHLVNKYGLDTLETGGLIAWAMELYEKGIIDEKDTAGLKLEWGNEEILFQLITQIAHREGFGNILADGFNTAISKIGKGSEYYAIQIKGMSSLHSDERPTPSLALGICTSTRGADHLRGRPAIDLYGLPQEMLQEIYGAPVSSDYTAYEGKSRMVWWQELLYAVTDAIGTCKFQTVFCAVHAPKWTEFKNLIQLATDMKFTESELMDVGERIYTIERMFNLREGFSRKDDALPERYFKESTPTGLPIAKGKKIDRNGFEKMLDEYYVLHGWDHNGSPKKETLERLGLDKEPSHIV
ncbi:MAG: aldehyde ferredoxin oxidoreductase family protein [Candidatus Bathyarchaeota archaeon]|nr:aldehyde ferredoxin oxidoreductase family protein [Candidatus Bathyarchaeota archaeon]MDH5786841.1 aldehyde ferredoxin oxidoreductase family protein [Candidatus Bathyarchaeota archaeon]